jgi:hypothetical protein
VPRLTNNFAITHGETPRTQDAVRRVPAHHDEQTRRAAALAAPAAAPGYQPESLAVLFGNQPS